MCIMTSFIIPSLSILNIWRRGVDSPVLNTQQRKKMRQEKRKKKVGEKAKRKSQDCCVTFKPQNLEILFSVHAQT